MCASMLNLALAITAAGAAEMTVSTYNTLMGATWLRRG